MGYSSGTRNLRLWVAIGGWLVLTVFVHGQAPVVRDQPLDADTNVGGTAAFRAEVTGASPMSYQWTCDGHPIPGATGAILVLDHATLADAGAYQLRVSNVSGSTLSAEARLVVRPAPEVPIVDARFRADASLRGSVSALLPLSDGGVLVALVDAPDGGLGLATAELVRLNAAGRIDPGFRRGAVAVDEFEPRPNFYPPRITQLILQPDGRLLVLGHFASYEDIPAPGIVRLNADGTVDGTFTVATDSFRPAGLTRTDESSFAPVAALQRDGKIVVINQEGALVRLFAHGARDLSFAPLRPWWGATSVTVDAAGRVVFGTGGERYSGAGAVVSALLEDGRPDPTFSVYSTKPVAGLQPQTDGKVLVTTKYDTGPVFPGTTRIRFPTSTFRLLRDGALDSGFSVRPVALLAASPDGRALLADGRLVAADGLAETMPNLGIGFGLSEVSLRTFAADGHLWLGGRFAIYNGVETPRIARLNLVASENLAPPRITAVWAEPATIRLGESTLLRVAAIGDGPLTYTWSYSMSGVGGITGEPRFQFVPYTTAQSGEFWVQVANSAGAVTSTRASVRIDPGELRITAQPRRVALTPGKWGWLSISLASTSAPTRYGWQRDGIEVSLEGPGAVRGSGPTYLELGVVESDHAGSYTLTLSDAAGQAVTSDPIVVTVGEMSRFTNLSTRAQIGVGQEAAILGFVIPPGQNREVLVRGVGPGLRQFGVDDALVAPRLEFFNAAGHVMVRSNSYERSMVFADPATLFAKVGAFPLAAGSADGALALTLTPGSYTARLSGIGDSVGTGLIELYETDNASGRLINLSSRVFVSDAARGAAHAGFVIHGPVPKRVLLRAAGPALALFGVTGVLSDPYLEVRSEDGRKIAANDDWQNQAEGAAVANAFASVGAFGFPPRSKDAALVTELLPGSYTAVVKPAESGTGIAMVEIYELP